MNFRLIGDSCADLTDAQKKDAHFITVPLVLQIGDYHIADDDSFDRKDFISRMKSSSIGAKTACPSPELFKEAYDCNADYIFVVTISEPLSGTYQSAVLAKELYEEEHGKKNIFVISSHSASSGQNLMLEELYSLCIKGLEFDDICARISKFRDEMKTYFVLESLETLRKNGRLSGLSAFIATTLNIKPVMGTNTGNIIKLDQARGINKALSKMVDIAIRENAATQEDRTVVIAECNNPERGEYVANLFRSQARFKDVRVIQTAGVATIYAGEGGIIVAIG